MKTYLLYASHALMVFGIAMLTYAASNPPMLALLGFSLSTLTTGVAFFCIWLWNRKVDKKYHEAVAKLNEELHLRAIELKEYPIAIKSWYRWKKHKCAQFPQFWAMFIWIMYIGALSIVSMYFESIPAPCVQRNDCAATQSRGIYIGE